MAELLKLIKKLSIKYSEKLRLYLGFFELFVLIFFFAASIFIVRHFFVKGWFHDPVEMSVFFILTIISWYALSKVISLAKLPRNQRNRFLIFYTVRSHLYVFFLLSAIKYLLFLNSIPLIFIFVMVSLTSMAVLILRIFTYRFLKINRTSGHNLHNVLLIADSFSEYIIDKLHIQKEWGFHIAGIITESKLIRAKYREIYKIFPDDINIKGLLDNMVIDEVIYCSSHLDEKRMRKIFNICKEVGVLFRLQSSFSPLEPYNFQLKPLVKTSDLKLVDTPSNNSALTFKIMSDIYISALALILLSPVMIIIALMIKLDSKGPVLYVQERIGLRGRRFNFYKFRTMVPDADKIRDTLLDKNQSDGPVFKIKDDPRITRTGKFLRKTGLDELPQLFNVIRGEMSLIGPRPPLASEVEKYERWQLRRLSVKPGITCSWQIVPNRNDVKFKNWMKMDLNYIDNWNLSKDIKLFFKTFTTIISANGR